VSKGAAALRYPERFLRRERTERTERFTDLTVWWIKEVKECTTDCSDDTDMNGSALLPQRPSIGGAATPPCHPSEIRAIRAIRDSFIAPNNGSGPDGGRLKVPLMTGLKSKAGAGPRFFDN